jgi:hypothetical protein
MILKVLLLLLKHILLLYIWTDPETESRSKSFYIPRDELLNQITQSRAVVKTLNSISQNDTPQLKAIVTLQDNEPEFNTFEDVLLLYDGESPNDFPIPKVIEGILITTPNTSKYI